MTRPGEGGRTEARAGLAEGCVARPGEGGRTETGGVSEETGSRGTNRDRGGAPYRKRSAY